MYRGDFDANQSNSLPRYLGSGDVHVFASADRRFGAILAEGGVQYDRLTLNGFDAVDLDVNLVSLDLTAGYHLEGPGELTLRPFVGLAPGYRTVAYDRIGGAYTEDPSVTEDFEQVESGMVVTFPMGVVIQDVVRIGARLTPGDNFDGFTRGSPIDAVAFVSASYRFDLLK